MHRRDGCPSSLTVAAGTCTSFGCVDYHISSLLCCVQVSATVMKVSQAMSPWNPLSRSQFSLPSLLDAELWRKRLWHLRQGGWSQLRDFERRRPHSSFRRLPAAATPLASDSSAPLFGDWPMPSPDEWKTRRSLSVGIIADPFTLSAFSYEWQQLELSPSQWREQISHTPIDLLFVESAWQGNDGQWRYQLTGSHAPSDELRRLVVHCQKRGIPTVFWNKEDPLHFDDFINTARIFDYVFTTDADVIPRYRKLLGHNHVYLMQFAAQPAVHNPIRLLPHSQDILRDVTFAGSYYQHKFPQRRQQLDLLLSATLAATPHLTTGLDIFARSAQQSENYSFPEKYVSYIRGELSPEQMLTANRSYKILLNANSVTSSETMCARRVFEATACGAAVLGVQNPAVSALFPDTELAQVTSEREGTFWIRALCQSPELRDRMAHLAQRRIWRDHTVKQRVDSLLATVGLVPLANKPIEVSVMVSTNRPHQLSHVLRQLATQRYVTCEPLIATHGFTASKEDQAYAKELGLNVTWLEVDATASLGECYNTIIKHASCEFIAKMDDDDIYGPYYLFDQVSAMRYSNANVVGKGAHYIYLGEKNCLVLRFPQLERRYSSFVVGATITTRTELLREVPFQHMSKGEDSQLLRDLGDQGCSIFASDRFGFVVIRQKLSTHTWKITAEEILSSSRVVSFGQNFETAVF